MGSFCPGNKYDYSETKEAGVVRALQGSDAEQVALFQGYLHPIMLLSQEFTLWANRELTAFVYASSSWLLVRITKPVHGGDGVWNLCNLMPALLANYMNLGKLFNIFLGLCFSECKTVLASKCYDEISIKQNMQVPSTSLTTNQEPNKCSFLFLSMIISLRFTKETIKFFVYRKSTLFCYLKFNVFICWFLVQELYHSQTIGETIF